MSKVGSNNRSWSYISSIRRYFTRRIGNKATDICCMLPFAGKEENRLKNRRNVATNSSTLNLNEADDVEKWLKVHPNLLAKPLKSPDAIYILNKNLADVVVQHLSPDFRKEDALIFEANPGPGCVTEALLKADVPKLRVFEKRSCFFPHLQQLENKYKGRFEVIEEEFLSLSKIKYKCESQGIPNVIFKDISQRAWSEEPPLKVFAIMPPKVEVRFMRSLLWHYIRFEGLYSFGRTQFLVFISEKEHAYMTAQPSDSFQHYTSSAVLYQTLFDIEVLLKEERNSFFPPKRIFKSEKSAGQEFMYLVRLTPKRYLLDVISPSLLGEFNFFVRRHYVKRRGLIAPTLDQWIPGSSTRLCELNINGRIMFGDLTPAEMLTLFLHFSSWPEYRDCLFRTALFKVSDTLDKSDDLDNYSDIE